MRTQFSEHVVKDTLGGTGGGKQYVVFRQPAGSHLQEVLSVERVRQRVMDPSDPEVRPRSISEEG